MAQSRLGQLLYQQFERLAFPDVIKARAVKWRKDNPSYSTEWYRTWTKKHPIKAKRDHKQCPLYGTSHVG